MRSILRVFGKVVEEAGSYFQHRQEVPLFAFSQGDPVFLAVIAGLGAVSFATWGISGPPWGCSVGSVGGGGSPVGGNGNRWPGSLARSCCWG